MGMSEFYGASDDAESLATLHAAVDLGVQHFDTADTYGFGHNESLLGQFLGELTGATRRRLIVATKFGIVRQEGRYERRIDNSDAYVRQACEASLRRLGVERIDLYYCHRRDPSVPIADLMGSLAQLVKEGKIAAIGLSEVSAETLREAHAVHPVAALQSEYSLWERGAETDLLPTAQAMGTAFVAYSPLGRAFLTDAPPQVGELADNDFRRALPRFNGEAGDHNRQLQERLSSLANAVGASTASLALAWMLHRQPHVLPIPGTRRRRHLQSNVEAAALALSPETLATLDQLFTLGAAQGERYPDAGWAGIETARDGRA
ncbi:aldo/keto reductase [Hydrogenophaga crassostreae]|uniref:Aldo/keto reductase n=2 Tax=Hydrogenophaga crassostreae TaxID=1763535 RepID=A0A163CLJ1_9BURK|nr:aldo/keto reductase [Hydrogenophaga crassostreae]OAD43389.1 aldo/keto reductase [Hydrogenophaga crassostreae]